MVKASPDNVRLVGSGADEATMAFFDRLTDRIATIDSVVCVGLDPDRTRLPDHLQTHDLPRWAFNRQIIDATHQHAAAYKLNTAFYEDTTGWQALIESIEYAKGRDVPVIIDGKRADIGNSAREYARHLDHADAITVPPYMGQDSIAPFLQRSDAGVFILCRTSNPGHTDLQDLELTTGSTLYEQVADLAVDWNANGNIGLVVGATSPDELAALRDRVPNLPFLVPGVGAQGGDIAAAAQYAVADGAGLVNSSRGIIYASDGESFAEAAGVAAKRLKRQLNNHR